MSAVLLVILAPGAAARRRLLAARRAARARSLQRRDDAAARGRAAANFSVCAELKGDAARACYSREVGRELAAVGGGAAPASRSWRRRTRRRGDVHLADAEAAQPLLCDLHARVGVTDEQVPSWLGWTEPLRERARHEPPDAVRRARARRRAGRGRRSPCCWRPAAARTPDAARERAHAGRRDRAGHAATSTPAPGWSRTRAAPATPASWRRSSTTPPTRSPRSRASPSAAYADQTGFLLANCHGIMHTVAREYALRTHLTLAKLMDNLPRDQRPGLLGGLRPRARHRGRAGDREGRPEGRPTSCAPSPRRATSATAARTASGTRSCASTTTTIQPSLQMCEQLGSRRRARLLPGRLPRLLVRGQRHRRHEQAQGRR